MAIPTYLAIRQELPWLIVAFQLKLCAYVSMYESMYLCIRPVFHGLNNTIMHTVVMLLRC